MANFAVEERDDFTPVCPYCEKELDGLIARQLTSSILTKRLVYCCPECRKVLGVSHRKGLWAN